MTLQNAIEIVEHHQIWRLGAEIEMIEPKLLTAALNLVIQAAKELVK